MLFRGVILEGVACAGKSTLLRALLRHPAYTGRPGASSIVLTEHQTQRVLESRGVHRRRADCVSLLRGHTDYLAGLAGRLNSMSRWREEDLPGPRVTAVLERFHLTHVLGHEALDWSCVAGVDELLVGIGMHLCLVVATPEELRRRLRPGPWDFLAEPGRRNRLPPDAGPDAIARHLADEQEALLALAERSRLPRVLIDTTTITPDEAVLPVLAALALTSG